MKLSNLAAIDDTLPQAGLSNASQADKAIWKEMEEDWVAIANEIEEARLRLSTPLLDAQQELDTVQSEAIGIDIVAETYVRHGQTMFRRAVLSAYQNRCCITGLADTRLLNASHIVPWREDPANRLNPQNGLCLSALHDRAFDRGLITLDQDLRVLLSPQIQSMDNEFVQISLANHAGKSIERPKKFAPRTDFLAFHREHIFLS